MSFPLEAAAARAAVPLGEKLRGFLERIHARPAYGRATAVGGELRLPGYGQKVSAPARDQRNCAAAAGPQSRACQRAPACPYRKRVSP